MAKRKAQVNRPARVFFQQPFAVVQIQRHGRWFDVNWIYADNKIACSTTKLSAALGKVTGVRVKYVAQLVKGKRHAAD